MNYYIYSKFADENHWYKESTDELMGDLERFGSPFTDSLETAMDYGNLIRTSFGYAELVKVIEIDLLNFEVCNRDGSTFCFVQLRYED